MHTLSLETTLLSCYNSGGFSIDGGEGPIGSGEEKRGGSLLVTRLKVLVP